LARWGGPRFVVVAPRGDRHGACVAAVRACRAVERSSIQLDSQPLQITVSVGLVYSSDYSVPVDLETLTNDGQRQLQLSKDAGGNTWSYLGRTASQAVAATQAAAQAPLP